MISIGQLNDCFMGNCDTEFITSRLVKSNVCTQRVMGVINHLFWRHRKIHLFNCAYPP